jgi:uncharacterized membrane protein
VTVRRTYIDWARALAVLAMIEAHTLDSWTRQADRSTIAFRDATIVGGFAAPLFLWLAGISLSLSAAAIAERQGSRSAAAAAVARRGLEIFVLGFLFRLQAFVASPGSHPITLFRVDILNIMGPAIAVAALLWALSATTMNRVVWNAAVAAAIAMMTPIVRTSPVVDLLPTWVQWYVRPAGEYTTFTGFPWAGFVFAGAACGVLLASVHDERAESRLHVMFSLAGAALVAGGFYAATLPSPYQQSAFWTSSPTYFAIRVGVMMILLAVIYVLALAARRRAIVVRPLERLGRNSLFVYWIHVELVYGYASWLWWRGLPLWGTAVGYVAFCMAMYGAVRMRDRFVQTWRAGRKIGPATEIAPA